MPPHLLTEVLVCFSEANIAYRVPSVRQQSASFPLLQRLGCNTYGYVILNVPGFATFIFFISNLSMKAKDDKDMGYVSL